MKDMEKWFVFKKEYSANNPENCIFKAYISNKDNYEIVIDENNIFGNIFLRIIKGKFVMHNLIEQEKENSKILMPLYEEYRIDNKNAIKNLEEYVKELPSDKLRSLFVLEEYK